jgi:Domain of unknown function (DUF4188)
MDVHPGRYTANLDGDFVVFLIGMRINELRRVQEWVPVMRAAFAMTAELRRMPDSPLLHSRTVLSVGDWRTPFFVQHWRSLDALEAWAGDRDLRHRPAQREFFRRTAYNGHVGVWHETYVVRAGEFEAIYANMPRTGLAAAGAYRDLRPSSTLRDRVGDTRAH